LPFVFTYLLTLDCLGLVSENFWDVSSRSRLEQKIERLGLVSIS